MAENPVAHARTQEVDAPTRFGKRDRKVIETGYKYAPSLEVNSLAASGVYVVLAADGYKTFVASGVATITLPVAADNVGRRLTFLQTSAGAITITQNADDANIGGNDSNLATLDADGDRVELICTGTEWLIAWSTIA